MRFDELLNKLGDTNSVTDAELEYMMNYTDSLHLKMQELPTGFGIAVAGVAAMYEMLENIRRTKARNNHD